MSRLLFLFSHSAGLNLAFSDKYKAIHFEKYLIFTGAHLSVLKPVVL